MPCIKIDKPLGLPIYGKCDEVHYLTLCKIRENLTVFTPKMQFLSVLMSCDE